ncbi:hypothetical protein FF1_044362 [Malus domestica]
MVGVIYVCDLSPRLQECLNFVKAHVGDEDIVPLMEKKLESRIELCPVLITVCICRKIRKLITEPDSIAQLHINQKQCNKTN